MLVKNNSQASVCAFFIAGLSKTTGPKNKDLQNSVSFLFNIHVTREKSPKRRHSIKKTDERVREPSPPPGEPMHVVHITNLVRPFTLGQLKDFLQVHGDYSDFWIDKIKSNCFVKVCRMVTYSCEYRIKLFLV